MMIYIPGSICLFAGLFAYMDKVLSAVKQLLEFSVAQTGSPLAAIKRVYFGDPITIPQSSQPALIVRPKNMSLNPRGSRYDEKEYNIEIVLVYNQADYYGSYKGVASLIQSASWLAGVATFNTQTNHGLSIGSEIETDGNNPAGYNGTFKVVSTPTLTSFTVAMATNPGAFSAGGKVTPYEVEKVFAVEAAVKQTEGTDNLPSQSIADYTICGTIQNNPGLPYIKSGVTYPTAAIANIRSVDYTFSNTRGFPAYEIIVSMYAKAVGDR